MPQLPFVSLVRHLSRRTQLQTHRFHVILILLGLLLVAYSEPPTTPVSADMVRTTQAPNELFAPPPQTALPPLRELADQLGITVGVDLEGALFSDPTYQQIVGREFNLATIDSGVYWIWSEPQKGQIVLPWADQELPFAQTRNMIVRGHPLVWVDNSNSFDSVPDWLLYGHASKDEWIGILRNHVSQIVHHYRGQMREWVVVNEASENGLFYTHIGADYIEIAFQAAREADPGAILIYNDYNNERPYMYWSYWGMSTPRTQDIVQRLKSKGLIDGVGLQMHVFNATVAPSKADMIAAMQSYGVPVYITECDVDLTGINGTQEQRFAFQATIYAQIADACIESGVCKSLTFWGIGDKYSWLETYLDEPDADATLYDDNLVPKPAYYAVQNSFYNHVARSKDKRIIDHTSGIAPTPDRTVVQWHNGLQTRQYRGFQPNHNLSTGTYSWNCYSDNAYPCNSALNSVEMLSAIDGWTVGDGGLILHWDGNSWSRVPSPTSSDLRSLSSVSSTDVWAVGYDGVVLHWNGQAWTQVSSPNSRDLRAVKMVSATDGWMTVGHTRPTPAAERFQCLRWNGTIWAPMWWDSLPSCFGESFAVRSNTDIWSVGLAGSVQRWNGSEWQYYGFYQGIETVRSFRSVAMSTDADGWAVGDTGTLYHWDGSLWTVVSSPTSNDLFGVAVTSNTDGWAVGDNGTILHWDGTTWSASVSPTNYALHSIAMISATDGWAVGYNAILHWDGLAWSPYKEPSPTIEDLSSVSLTSASDGWAVGYGGTILRWNGDTWSQVSSPITSALHSVATTSASDGWSVGADGVILRWNGSTWSSTTSPTSETLYSTAVDSSGNGWTVGTGGTILQRNGSGWAKVSSPTAEDLGAVAIVSGSDAWAVGNGAWGYGSTILHWNGSSWSRVTSPITTSLSSISMISHEDGWAVGQAGKIIHWNGHAWSEVASPTTDGLLAVRMISPSDGWATGFNGTTLHWDGSAWSLVGSPSTRALYSIARSSFDMTGAWVVGAGGIILYYEGMPLKMIYLPLVKR